MDDLGSLVAQNNVPTVKVAEIETFIMEELQSLEHLPADSSDIV